jgi:hypothetical protein
MIMPDIDYKKRCEEYEKRMGIGDNDPERDGYLVLVEILRQQNAYLKSVKITELIKGSEEKGKASEYERAKGLWEKLSNMIESVHGLKIMLKMEGEEKKTDREIIKCKINI